MSRRRLSPSIFAFLLITSLAPIAGGQTATATVTAGSNPYSLAVNPVTNKIYVTNFGSNTVTVIDGATNSTATVTAGSNPTSVAVNPVTNKIYVANRSSADVTVIDGATNSTTNLPAGTFPNSVAVNPVTNMIYVANRYSDNVTVIDGATNSITNLPAGTSPNSVAVNPVTNKIYVANYSSANVTVIDGVTNFTTVVAAGTYPYSVAVNPVTNKIYVTNNGSANVTVIDGVTNSTATVTVGGYPHSVAVNPVTNKIYVNGDTVTVIDGATNSTATLTVGLVPFFVAVNPVTNKIYVTNYSSANVTVIDGVTNSTATVTVGSYQSQVAVNPVTNKIYVANYYGANNVTVIDGATNSTATVAAGSGPTSVAVNPVTNKIYIANSGSANVTMIDGATKTTTTLSAGTVPYAVDVNPVTNKVYVANLVSANVTVISANSTATVAAGNRPQSVAVNPVTNKIYVANNFSANVTVIDGLTNSTATVAAGSSPFSVAVNPVTNKIYVSNRYSNNVTVIDGATNSTVSVAVGNFPQSVAVNPVTNKIYVVNNGSDSVTVIDGATNSITTLAAGSQPNSVAVNPVTNKIYVTNYLSANVTVIDGLTRATTSVAVGSQPSNVAVNPVTNKIYVTGGGSVIAVIDGATTNTTPAVVVGSGYHPLAVNPVTGEIYVGNNADGTVTVVSEQQTQTIPLQTTVGALSSNQTSNSSPSFNFTAQSSFSPTAPTPQRVFYQADTWQSSWTAASGTNPSFSGTVGPLQAGIHILYAYAGDGQDATSTEAGSPLTGAIAAYLFLVTTPPGLPVSISPAAGTPQSAGVNSAFALALQATVADGAANPVNGAAVTFTAPASQASGTFSGSATVLTNASGVATAPSFMSNGIAGTYSVSAAVAGVASPAIFSLTNLSSAPASLTALAGTPQSAQANAAFPAALQAKVKDGSNSPLSGVWVTFAAPASAASGTFSSSSTVLTDASGIATAPQFTANGYAGTYTVTAKTASLTANFTLTNTPVGLYFVPITPCRVLDTRNANGPFGGPAITGQTSRSFVIPNSACNIPANAQAYSANVAVVPQGQLGFLTVWPTGQAQPYVATLNSDGRIKSNAAIIPAGTGGAINAFATNTTDVVLDINGYFLPSNNAPAGVQFYPITPCRLVDTRLANGSLAGPFIGGQTTRTFPLTSGSCGIPGGVQAFSLNFAAVPRGPLGFLTAWPTGQSQPYVANLNAPTGTVTANAGIVPAGTNGSINVFATNDTDLVIDVNGYFAAPGSAGALSLYNVPPCRVLDTRLPAGSQPFSGTINVNAAASGCGAPATAQALVFNATGVPSGGLGFLTLWPQGTVQPYVATLNANDGAITGNMAIVPDANGSVSAFATNPTHLVLDLFGYFAP